jgi:hypothetical protein
MFGPVCRLPGVLLNTTATFSCIASQANSSSSIQEAAGQGDMQQLKALLGNGAAVDSRDDSGCTALHFAADRGQADALELLLASGADVNAADADGQTPLHYAAMCGHQEVRVSCQSGTCAPDLSKGLSLHATGQDRMVACWLAQGVCCQLASSCTDMAQWQLHCLF